jgi:formylglycine-generating enzyme required for sulfatase activity/serine/threonine protein kinase
MNDEPFRPEAGAEPLPGYTLERLLGRGGFGEVWKATAPGGFRVALKFLAVAGEEASRELTSLRLLVNLRDSHLLNLHGVWAVPGYHVLAMELADGTLMDRLKECLKEGMPGIPRDELLRYFRQAAAGIDFLNEARHDLDDTGLVSIQHGDIKPQNLLIVGSGVKVGDFGLLRLLHTQAGSLETGTLTVLYAAPEVFGRRLARQSDQYSLAVTWCQLRGGRPPFEGTMAEVMAGHLTREPDLSMLPEEERASVAQALSKTPSDRWPTCEAFVEALAGAVVPARAAVAASVVNSPYEAATGPFPPDTASSPVSPAAKQSLARTVSRMDDTVDTTAAPRASRTWRGSSSGSLRWAILAIAASVLALTATILLTHRPSKQEQPAPGDPESKPPANAAQAGMLKPMGATPPETIVKAGEPWQPHPRSGTAKSLEKADDAVVARTSPRAETAPEVVMKRRLVVNSLGMRLVWIEPGTFRMGSPKDEKGRIEGLIEKEGKKPFAFETPHKVTLTHGFYLGAHLVTQVQWVQLMKANPSKFTDGDPTKLPVDNVSWDDCDRFCEALRKQDGYAYRPPTEAEWEYACRAGKESAFNFGDDESLLKEHGWFDANSDGRPHPVGEKTPNAWGLYDMHGNLFQWCEDFLTPFTEDAVVDPPPAKGKELRMLRGGAWSSPAEFCRCAFRLPSAPDKPTPHFGLRVVCRQPVLEAAVHPDPPPPEFRPIAKP